MDGDILYIITATVSLAICLIIFFKSPPQSGLAKWLLEGYFLCSFFTVAITYVVFSPYIRFVPHLFRTGSAFFLLIMPVSWLYFRYMLKGKGLSWADLVHTLPFLFYIIDYAPFFVLPGEKKLAILEGLTAFGVKGAFAEGWLMPPGGHNIIRFPIMAVYWFVQWRLLKQHSNENIPQRVNWLHWLLYTELLIFGPAVVTLLLDKKEWYNLVGNFSGLLGVLIQGYVLFMKPEILYGFPSEPYVPQTQSRVVEEEWDDEVREHKPLEHETVQLIQKGLSHLMNEQQRFRRADLKIFHLAEEMGVPTYKLSAYFKEVEHQNFIEYINQRRVAYCISRIQSGEARAKTLEALSLESGFNTRSTFIRAFKKVTGKIPSAFIEEVV